MLRTQTTSNHEDIPWADFAEWLRRVDIHLKAADIASNEIDAHRDP
jgi:hypothetical protein